MEAIGTHAPLVGYLMQPALVAPGETVSVAGWANPAVEPEVAVHVGPGGEIAALSPAFELVDLDPLPPAVGREGVEALLAGDIYQRGVMLGQRTEVTSLAGITARVTHGESTVEVDDPQALTGPIDELLAHVAGVLAAFGEELREGDVLICGAIAPPLRVAPGDEVRYELAPLGRLAARFAG